MVLYGPVCKNAQIGIGRLVPAVNEDGILADGLLISMLMLFSRERPVEIIISADKPIPSPRATAAFSPRDELCR